MIAEIEGAAVIFSREIARISDFLYREPCRAEFVYGNFQERFWYWLTFGEEREHACMYCARCVPGELLENNGPQKRLEKAFLPTRSEVGCAVFFNESRKILIAPENLYRFRNIRQLTLSGIEPELTA